MIITLGDRSFPALDPQPELAQQGDLVMVVNPNMLIPAGSTGRVAYVEGGRTKVRLTDGTRSNWQSPVTLHRSDFVITDRPAQRRTA